MERALGGPAERGARDAAAPCGPTPRALRASRPDLALDLQGDVRAAWLMALTGARERVGYANTGGARLLTRVVPLDETVSWIEQNRRAVGGGGRAGGDGRGCTRDLLTAADRQRGPRDPRRAGLDGPGPWSACTRVAGARSSNGRRAVGARSRGVCSANSGPPSC